MLWTAGRRPAGWRAGDMTEKRQGPRRRRPDRRAKLTLHVPERRSGIDRRQGGDRRAPGTVLVVDSEPVFCDVLCRVIEDAGHEVYRIASRTDLLAAFLKDSVEVAVVMVPPLETMELIREGHPDTEIVALVTDADRVSHALGSAVALQEPFTEEKIRAALRIALRKARKRDVRDSPA